LVSEQEQLRAQRGALDELESFAPLRQVAWKEVRTSLVILDHDLADFPGLDNQLAAEKSTAVFE